MLKKSADPICQKDDSIEISVNLTHVTTVGELWTRTTIRTGPVFKGFQSGNILSHLSINNSSGIMRCVGEAASMLEPGKMSAL